MDAQAYLVWILADTLDRYGRPLLEPLETAIMRIEASEPEAFQRFLTAAHESDVEGLAIHIAQAWYDLKEKEGKKSKNDEKQ